MEKNVYLLCPNCKGLTLSKCIVKPDDDLITCSVCNNEMPAKCLGKLKPQIPNDVKELYLYIHKYNFSNCFNSLNK